GSPERVDGTPPPGKSIDLEMIDIMQVDDAGMVHERWGDGHGDDGAAARRNPTSLDRHSPKRRTRIAPAGLHGALKRQRSETSPITKTEPSDRLGSGQAKLLLAVCDRPKQQPVV